MKLTSVELSPEGSTDKCIMSFRDPARLNPYNVKQIVGLDADELVPRGYRSNAYGPAFYEMIMPKRNPVFLVELNPDFSESESFSDLRDRLYRLISSSRRGIIEVSFKNGETVKAKLLGHVSKFETSLFTQNPEVQITLNCRDSILRAPEETIVNVAGLDPALTEIIDNESTAPHGVAFTMKVLADRPPIIIEDPTTQDWSFEIDLVASPSTFLANDVIYCSSEYGNKYIYMVRNGVTTHLADKLALGSVWPMIFPGVNHFSVSDPTTVEWLSIQHRVAYWGV